MTESVTERAVTREEAAEQETKILTLWHQAERTLTQVALELERFIERKMYLLLGFKTLTDWRESRFGDGYKFFEMRRAAKLLKAGVPSEDIEAMPLTNIHNLTRLPERCWKDKRWIQAAVSDPAGRFEERVRDSLGEAAEETSLARGFRGPASLIAKWDLALKVAELEGAERLTDRIEAFLSSYLNAASEADPKRSRLQWYMAEKVEESKTR